jgi:hypothetical protein
MRANLHQRALICAAIHFLFCLWIGAALLIFGVGDAVSDTWEETWILDTLYHLFIILEAPSVAFFSRVEFEIIIHFIDTLLVAALWSLLLGYIISFLWGEFEECAFARAVRGIKT